MNSFNLILFIFTLGFVTCTESGAKLAISEDVVLNFEKKLLPQLIAQLGDIKIPDTNFDFDAKIMTVHAYLRNIHFSIKNLTPENVQITFAEPNLINIQANNIQGNGELDIQIKMSFISETDHVNISINRVNTRIAATLTTTESRKEKGKLLPSGTINSLDLDVDFDFDIHGSVVAWVANLIKGTIKGFINNEIQTRLKQLLIQQSGSLINDFINQFPIYVPVAKDLVLDYSLLEAPKILGKYLILYSNGAIIDQGKQSDLERSLTELPDVDPNGKAIQLFLSEYSIETALKALYADNILDITVNSSDLPPDAPIHLNTDYLETLIPGISDRYGKSAPINFRARVISNPDLTVKQESINSTFVAEVTFYGKLNDTFEEAIVLNTTINAGGDATVREEGAISVQINNLHIQDTIIVKNHFPKVDINAVEILFNFGAQIAIPVLNEKYLKLIKVTLPSFQGITFENSTISLHDGYVELNVAPQFHDQVNEYLIRNMVSYFVPTEKMVFTHDMEELFLAIQN